MAQVIYPNATSNPRLMKCSSAAANSTQSSSAWNEQHEDTLNACSKSEDRYRQGQVIQTTSAGSYLFSAKRYSCFSLPSAWSHWSDTKSRNSPISLNGR